MEGDFSEKKLTVQVTSSEKVSRRVLSESFGIDLCKHPECQEVKNSRFDVTRWLYTCTFDCEQNIETFLYAVDRFCKHFKPNGYVSGETLLDEIQDIVELDHKYLEVDHFALGHWSDLDIFIERFTSVPTKDWQARLRRIQASFYHDRGNLEIYFRDDIRGSTSKFPPVYKLLVRYADIKKIVTCRKLRHKDTFYDCNNKREPMELYLHVSSVLAFRWNSVGEDAYENFFEGLWTRQVSFGTLGTSTRCNHVGENRVFKIKLQHKGTQEAEAIYSLFRASGAPMVFANVKCVEIRKENIQPLPKEKLSDELQYAIQCIQSIAPELSIQIHLKNIRKDIQGTFESFAKKNKAAFFDSLYEIYYEAKKGFIIDLKTAIEDTFRRNCQANQSGQHSGITQNLLPMELCLVKKATVCPSKIIFEPPTIVRASPLLRQCDLSRVLLVDLRDDNFTKIQTTGRYETEELIENSLKVKIQKGLKIGKKKYTFLGASREQFSEHCFWMYESDKNDNLKELYKRLGICGTLTERMKSVNALLTDFICEVNIDQILVKEDASTAEPDFKRGYGRISSKSLDYICRVGKLQKTAALKVVHGRYTGIIVLDPELEGLQIIYRTSQRILNCDSNIIYIVSTANCEPALFDKVLLSTLSSKQDGHCPEISIGKFEALVSNTFAESAASFLSEPPELASEIDKLLSRTGAKMAELFHYDVRNDVLFRQTLKCNQLKRIRNLKELKLNIPGTFRLMPVVDEYGVLEEGQIYVRIGNIGNETKSLSGCKLMVARKDAMHPSEIRVFKAVETNPETDKLQHLTDCVVFSAKGSTPPLKHFCSNNDFPGESDVILIANEDFLFKQNTNELKTTLEVNTLPCEDKSLLSHYFDCLKFVVANNIAEVFCALSDRLPTGANSNACAKVRAIRDQFEKFFWGTGGEPEPLIELTTYPDFLQRMSDKGSYCSDKALGACCRQLRLIDIQGLTSKGFCKLEIDNLRTGQNALLSELESNEEFHKEAAKTMAMYTKRLRALEAMYGLTTEEVRTGIIFTLPESRCPPSRVARLESTMRCYMRHLSSIIEERFSRSKMRLTKMECAAKMSAYFAQAIEKLDDGGYGLPWLLPNQMLMLLASVNLTPASIYTDDFVQKYFLKNRKDTDSLFDLQLRIEEQVMLLIGRWVKKHLNLIVLKRDDKDLVEDLLTELVHKAFMQAWDHLWLAKKTDSHERQLESLNQFLNNPHVSTQLLSCILREVILDGENTQSGFHSNDLNRHRFIEMSLKSLLCNVLVKAAIQGSFKPLIERRSVLHSKIVSGVFLLPLSNSELDEKYVRYTQGNLEEFTEILQEYSACNQVQVKVLPPGERDDNAFEEVFYEGEWFTVENLKTIMLSLDFRRIICTLFEDKYKIHHREQVPGPLRESFYDDELY